MYAWPFAAWTQVGIDAMTLGAEASAVVGLRLARIAVGGAEGEREARLMVTEKMQSTFELQMAMATGGLGTTPLAGARSVLSHYRRKVAANRRRLG